MPKPVDSHKSSDTSTMAGAKTFRCAYHRSQKTRIRCSRCGKPICTKCAVPTEVGQRCPDCAGTKRKAQGRSGAAVFLRWVVVIGVIVAIALFAVGPENIPLFANWMHDRQLEPISTYFVDEQYEDAIDSYSTLLETEGETDYRFQVLSKRAEAYEADGNWRDALEDYAEALAIAEDVGVSLQQVNDIHRIRLDIYIQQEAWNEALQTADYLVNSNEDDYDILAKRGEVHLQLGEFELAIQDLEGAVRAEIVHLRTSASEVGTPQDETVWAWVQLSEVYRKLDRQHEAIVMLDQVLQSSIQGRNRASLLSARGFAYLDLDEYDQARRDFDNALALDDDLKGVWAQRAQLNSEEGRYDEAKVDAEKALSLCESHNDRSSNDATCWDHHFVLGYVYSGAGQHEEAIDQYSMAIDFGDESNPGIQTAYGNRGVEHTALSHLDQAIADYTKAIEMATENQNLAYLIILYDYRANTYQQMNDDMKANQDRNQAEVIRQQLGPEQL